MSEIRSSLPLPKRAVCSEKVWRAARAISLFRQIWKGIKLKTRHTYPSLSTCFYSQVSPLPGAGGGREEAGLEYGPEVVEDGPDMTAGTTRQVVGT